MNQSPSSEDPKQERSGWLIRPGGFLLGKWFVLAIAILFVVGYSVAMLWIPAMPVAGLGGEISQISRLEFWLILVASFETIWNQWTTGYPPAISDRFLNLACGTLWVVISAILGWPIVRRDRLTEQRNRSSTLSWSVAVGAPIAALCVAGNAATLGPQSRVGLIAWLVSAGLGLHLGIRRAMTGRIMASESDRRSHELADTVNATDSADNYDPALDYSWARRLMGLTTLGIAWALVLTLSGACLPTYDADVREHRIMATRNYYLENRLYRLEHQREANIPQGAMMPALFWMSAFVATPPDPLHSEAIRGMVDSVLIGQIVQGMYWCVAIWILIGSLTRMHGIFAAVLASFAIAAHPGLFELVRLGGGAGEGGMYLVAAASLMLHRRASELPSVSLACIAAGAAGQGWMMFLMVTIPIAFRLAVAPPHLALRRTYLLIFLAVIAIFWGGAFVWQIVNAGLTRGRAGEGEQAFLSQYLPFFFSPSNRIGEGAWSALLRISFFSMTHAVHLIPIATIGLAVSRSRVARDAWIWFGLGCLLWWIFTPQQDRDWVLVVPLLAWPMANGIAWMRERGQGGWLVAVSGAALIWSVIVLCAWPTSDNRLLVPLGSLVTIIANSDSTKGRGGEEELEEVTRSPTVADAERLDLAPSVNRLWNRLERRQKSEKWLLMGSADAFRWLPNVELFGIYDTHPWKEVLEHWSTQPAPERTSWDLLQQNRIGFVVVDWDGWRYRDRLLGTQNESKYRNAIQRLQQSGALKRVTWEHNSSRAECFQVIDSQTTGRILSQD